MKEVRGMESNITHFQNELRQKIYKKEINLYREIGEERLDDFYDQYDREFRELNEY